ncbi:hypothetical protein FVE85_0971 [Porphyridium purpureum]|uniref:Photosystem II Psb31 protein domain-containing protein n=1 Tax=Porphyridium purpureum TaxID=35688 RepID=A0A5J4Z270_PORPP|nr:Chain G6, PSII_Pbs31 domain-containing protein [Porphyridium purpureum]7Y5E_GL Chain GL, PSII_Pbs31 domain-containing protein [Porphyridium purpureum]7Y5E_g6 Chain g6, PSII_Pbs31 domain-containing protein [Porphyridium purpureum]7Y5E_gL Chain gL, PSII_Pbs31 domain-containing protein [Porphyridium purpureum]7Y7A_G9 Chain G9, PSII_Pbs31 domain-containing protein [Porphyridium purpureum]7Y7A_GE Chain GE, PSII_Pbs31 domain-containing protein [Porphyridium purpureum]7Y7A_GO Chain GO, PSII_Pbs31|eukprot:POR7803..scf208_2
MAFVNGVVPVAASASVHRRAVCVRMSEQDAALSRRAVLGLAGSAAAALALAAAPISPALADGAVSSATKYRARNLYGSRIFDAAPMIEKLVAAVNAKNWDTVESIVGKKGPLEDLKNSFTLFATGAYPTDKLVQTDLIGNTAVIYEMAGILRKAADQQDQKKALKAVNELVKSYKEYLAAGELKENPFADAPGQAWSGDFSPLRKTGKSPYIE